MPASALAGETLLVDGYNVLLTVEAALSGGVLLLGRDGVLRGSFTSMSGHYRRMRSTRPALEAIAAFCSDAGCSDPLSWYFDRPISNSGRLKQAIDALASEAGWAWDVELVAEPGPHPGRLGVDRRHRRQRRARPLRGAGSTWRARWFEACPCRAPGSSNLSPRAAD